MALTFSAKILGVVLCVLYWNNANFVSSAEIKVEPAIFLEAVTEEVRFSCCPDGTSARAKEILLIEIAKDGATPIVNLREGSQVKYGDAILTNKFQAAGLIDKDVGRSFLNLTLRYPSIEDAGTYTCVISYFNMGGFIQLDRNSGQLVIDRIDKQNTTTIEDRVELLESALSNVLDRVKTLERENSQLQKDTRNQTKQIGLLTDKGSYMSAFSAAVNEATKLVNGMVVSFPDVILQEGQGYNSSTGVFTVPRAGLYAFHLVMEIGSGDTVGEISLMADNKELARLYSQDKDYGDQSSVSSIVSLQQGSEVKAVVVSAAGANPKALGDNLCVFSGHLIRVS